ncbi:MAG: hypothetical protein QOG62_1855, partial [Thermoleophilaceae bacterium]|nr:hypothetical protein [Thermoleophilaceae bacterium]
APVGGVGVQHQHQVVQAVHRPGDLSSGFAPGAACGGGEATGKVPYPRMARRRPGSSPGLMARVRWGNLGRLAALVAAGLTFALVPRGGPPPGPAAGDMGVVEGPATTEPSKPVAPVRMARRRDRRNGGKEGGGKGRPKPKAAPRASKHHKAPPSTATVTETPPVAAPGPPPAPSPPAEAPAPRPAPPGSDPPAHSGPKRPEFL